MEGMNRRERLHLNQMSSAVRSESPAAVNSLH
jgi:hypothetical protein